MRDWNIFHEGDDCPLHGGDYEILIKHHDGTKYVESIIRATWLCGGFITKDNKRYDRSTSLEEHGLELIGWRTLR